MATNSTEFAKKSGAGVSSYKKDWKELNGGEGFHADHHAEPQVARHGPVDAVYAAICALERIGLVYDVQHPKGATKPSIRIDDVQDMGKATKSSKRRVQS